MSTAPLVQLSDPNVSRFSHQLLSIVAPVPQSVETADDNGGTAKNGIKSPQINQLRPGNAISRASPTQHIPCKFFKSGACTAGSNCSFSHSLEAIVDPAICKYYLKGSCKFGSKCALAHTVPTKNGRKSSNLSMSSTAGSVTMAIPIRQNAAPPRKRLLSNPVPAASHSSHSPSSDSYLSESLRSDSAFSSSLQSESARQYNQYASSWNGNPSSLKSIWMLHSETNIPYEQSQQRVPHTYSQSHQRTTTTNSNFNSVFLSMSYDEKSSSHLTSQSPTRKLSSIPEQDARRSFDLTNDDDNDNEEHQILPSSLNELLTPAERRRYSIQSDLMRLAGSGDGNGLMGQSPPVEHDWFSPNPNSSPSRSLFGASNNEPRMQTFNPMNGRLSSSVPQSSFNNLPFNGHLQTVQPFNNAQDQLISNHPEKIDSPGYLIDDEGAPFYMEPLNESSIEAAIDGGIETGNSPNKNDLSGTVTSLLTLSLNERGESPAGVNQKTEIGSSPSHSALYRN